MTKRQERIRKANRKLIRLIEGNEDYYGSYGETAVYGIIDLLRKQPKAARIRERDGELPLHRFMCYSYCYEMMVDFEILQALVQAYPASLKLCDYDGDSPLHVACLERTSNNVHIIRYLVEEYSEALVLQNMEGDTPMHTLLTRISDGWAPELLSLTEFVLEAYPEAAIALNSKNETLLHTCISYCLDEDMDDENQLAYISLLKLLIQAFPGALKHRDTLGQTPLHMVCKCYEDNYYEHSLYRQVFELLVASDEASIMCKDSSGESPLHLLSSRGASEDILSVLLTKHPNMAGERNSNGQNPLHCALEALRVANGEGERYFSPQELFEFRTLMQGTHARPDGFNPSIESLAETVSCLLDASPLGAYEIDNGGITPLQLAYENNLDLSVVYKLVRVDPVESLSCLGLRPLNCTYHQYT